MTKPATTGNGSVAWLVLAYRLPASPGLKATIRRRLTAMGAVFPTNAVATVPASPAAERAFRRLRNTISKAGGSALVLQAEAIEGSADLVSAFNTARDRDYEKVISGCSELAIGIQALTAACHFRYQDLNEKDAELARLSERNGMISAQNAFGATRAEPAASALSRCQAILDEFATRVYEADTCPGNTRDRRRGHDHSR